MGISIISVILFHFFKDYIEAAGENAPAFMTMFQDLLGSSGVDTFLFLSGIGLYYSYKNSLGKRNVFKFYLVRLIRVLLPYLIVAIPADYVRRVIYQGKEPMEIVRDLTFYNFYDNGENWYWYIGMICACYLIFPILFHIVDRTTNIVEETIFNILVIALISLLAYGLFRYNEELFGNINIAVLRFPAFFVGIFTGKRAYKDRHLNIIFLLGIVALLYFDFVPQDGSNMIIRRYLYGLNGLLLCFIFCLFFHITQIFPWHPIKRTLEFIGNYTLELYLVHVTIRPIMGWMGFAPNTYLLEGVLLLITILLSALVYFLTRPIFNWIR